MKLERLTVERGVWKHGEGETTPAIRVLKRGKRRGRFFVAAIAYSDARALADALHDACDEYEKEQRDGAR